MTAGFASGGEATFAEAVVRFERQPVQCCIISYSFLMTFSIALPFGHGPTTAPLVGFVVEELLAVPSDYLVKQPMAV